MNEDKILLTSETTNLMWKSWTDWLNRKRIKEATIEVFFFNRGVTGDEDIYFGKTFKNFSECVLGVSKLIVAHRGRIGQIDIMAGTGNDFATYEDISILACMEDIGHPDNLEHIQMCGNKYQQAQEFLEQPERRRKRKEEEKS